MRDETKCLHSGYQPENGAPSVIPIVQSTTYRFDSTEHLGRLFDMPTEFMYSRFANPTVDAVEKKIAALEGGVGALCTTSGQAATFLAILNLCNSGDSFISTTTIYGGSINLFAVTLKKLGIECIFVDGDDTDDNILKAFKKNTRAFFSETIANPALKVCDIERLAVIAHQKGVPFIIDNTFATPILCKPIEYGADIVIHSTTKYMDGHAIVGGGVIVDSGRFDWTSGNFPEFTEPDESYHGVIYTRDFGKLAYIVKARMQLMRDIGAYPAATSAFYLNLGLETLAIRMKQYCDNALTVAKYFAASGKIETVYYPYLEQDSQYEKAHKYLIGASGVVTIIIKGGKANAVKFMDGLKLASNEVHVADIRTCVLHPASETHRQLTEEQLLAAGIDPGMIRFSVGLENIEDILNDIHQSLKNIHS